MLSRLKRRSASTSQGDPSIPRDASTTSSPSASRQSTEVLSQYGQASPTSSRPGSPTRTQKPNRHSFATPVRTDASGSAGDFVDEVGRTLSPTRVHGNSMGRTSRSSSISSHTPDTNRRSLTLPSPVAAARPQATAAAGGGAGRLHDQIGHGSLSLDHLEPRDGNGPMTLVVHAPELLSDGQQPDWHEQGEATPIVTPGSEQRTPLAPPHSLSVPSSAFSNTGNNSSTHTEHQLRTGESRHRALTTGDLRFAPTYPANGLDALAAINVPSGVVLPSQESSSSLSARSRRTHSPSLSPDASRNASRPMSRRSSSAAEDVPLRRGRSATMAGSSKRSQSKSTAISGAAGTSSPTQQLGVPSPEAAQRHVAAGGESSDRKYYTTLHEPSRDSLLAADVESGPAISARNSLESHISPYLATTEFDDPNDQRSVYGDHGTAFLSMDQLGDFDDVVSQLGTGYAVASSKRNADFHALFKHIPDDDYLIEDYGCALQREILIQGRLYISEHHLSFNANIFGWVTSLTIPFSEVVSIEKRMTAYVIPNAIQITTLHARHIFASFLSRDTTYDLIGNIWRMVHPVVPMSAALPDSMSNATHCHIDSDEEGMDPDQTTERVVNASGVETGAGGERRMRDRAKRKLFSGRRRGGTDATDKSASSAVSNGETRGATEAPHTEKESANGSPAPQLHAPTVDTCPTLRNLKEVCLDTVFPGKPEKIYNLMFTSGFMKNFWAENQRLMEIQIGDWAPQSSGSHLLARSMSYIKPLNGSIGPKQTKCLITDESAHVDFDDFVCVITTTRTPDVPSGSAFAVKTRTSMTWGKGNKCRVVVTTGVEWSKSSFIKGIIEKSAIDGQKQYHSDLEKAMRVYISTHRNEFVEEGDDPDAAAAAGNAQEQGDESSAESETGEPAATTVNSSATSSGQAGPLGPLRAIVEPVFQALAQQSATSLALGAVVAFLLLSNLWTLRGVRNDSNSLHPAERARRHVLAGGGFSATGDVDGPAGSPDHVANAVRDVLNNYFAAAAQGSLLAATPDAGTSAPVATASGSTFITPNDEPGRGGDTEIDELAELLDRVEERARRLRAELAERRKASESSS
ncbi:hypothetical protein JCM10908_005399 [Rhodotorula pacifica]|uniref:GRAM and VASt domain-containing protein n=1 Tax=Rhodotorula pacifica TaxID=1495444 RepID=UPI0031777069